MGTIWHSVHFHESLPYMDARKTRMSKAVSALRKPGKVGEPGKSTLTLIRHDSCHNRGMLELSGAMETQRALSVQAGSMYAQS